MTGRAAGVNDELAADLAAEGTVILWTRASF